MSVPAVAGPTTVTLSEVEGNQQPALANDFKFNYIYALHSLTQ
jgi:hypothetical protein